LEAEERPQEGPRAAAGEELIVCNLCGADDARMLFLGWDRLPPAAAPSPTAPLEQFPVVQCRQCGLIYLNPRPTPGAIGRFYPADYRPYVAPLQAARARRRIARWDARYGLYKRLRAVAALQPAGRLLDVGCGSGDFLAFAREHGWEVHGVELVDAAAAYCRDQLNLPVVTGDLLAARLPAAHFDVVTLWNALEHLHDPAAALREIRRILRPGGLLVAAVPDAGSLDARLFGPAWIGYDVPRHLYTFSAATLDRMLAQAGFRDVRRRCLESSHFVFFLSLEYWLRDPANARRWGWAAPWVPRVRDSRLVRLLTAPYFRLIDSLVKGPVVTTFARPVAEGGAGASMPAGGSGRVPGLGSRGAGGR